MTERRLLRCPKCGSSYVQVCLYKSTVRGERSNTSLMECRHTNCYCVWRTRANVDHLKDGKPQEGTIKGRYIP